ncbi:MAG: DNA-methyltransferase [Salibacteraceae bacterium]
MHPPVSTLHRFYFEPAAQLSFIDSQSVELVVTSPPYPMIAMWDAGFSAVDPEVERALEQGQGQMAFERMHWQLDAVWKEMERCLVPGGIACINIGDATRTIGGVFSLYANHARIITAMERLGMRCLPLILWRKPTNAPNKFMGSGMLPPGAYVTLEHEYVLVFRKGDNRGFAKTKARELRNQSAYFWEERNQWFSDLWEFRGAQQKMGRNAARARSAAFPLELPFRLIQMYSVAGETVLDPFAGTGTTALAALVSGRNSLSVEVQPELRSIIRDTFAATTLEQLNARQRLRLQEHLDFVAARGADRFKHHNAFYDFPVMTRQEIQLQLPALEAFQWQAADQLEGHYGVLKADF